MATSNYNHDSSQQDVREDPNGDVSMCEDNHPVWTYYTITVTDRVEGRNMKRIECKTCDKVWMNMRRERAKNHIEKCIGVQLPRFKTWPAVSGVAASPKKQTPGKKVPKKRGRPRLPRPGESVPIGNDSWNYNKDIPTPGRVSFGSVQSRSFSKSSKNRRIVQDVTQDTTRKIHDLLAEWIISQSIPFSAIDNAMFLQIFQNLPTYYVPPSSDFVLHTILPSLSDTVIAQMRKCIVESDDRSMTLEFDIWTDRSHKTFYAFVLHSAGVTKKRFLHSLVHDESAIPTVEAITSTLEAVIADIGENKINCLKGESAREVRELITTELPQIIQHGCVYRLVTLLVCDLAKVPDVHMAVSTCVKIYDYLLTRPDLRQKLPDFPSIKKLEYLYVTRCCGQMALLNFVAYNGKAIKDLIESSRETLDSEHQELLAICANTSGLWEKIGMISKFLVPLAQLVKIVEDENATISDFVHCILSYMRELYDAPPCSMRNFLLDVTVKRFKELDKRLMIAAYIIDPRYKMEYLTPKAKTIATAYLVKLCYDSGVRLMTQLNNLRNQFSMYEQKRNPFKAVIGLNDDPVIWWSGIEGAQLLRDLAIRLLRLKTSSAMCEQLWSYLDLCNFSRSRLMKAQFESVGRVFMKNRPQPSPSEKLSEHSSLTTANFLQEIQADIVDEVYPFVEDPNSTHGDEFSSIDWLKEYFTFDGVVSMEPNEKQMAEKECRLEDALEAICPDAVSDI